MIDWPNVSASSSEELGQKPEELQRSKCVLGFIPVVYYSILLCVGVPGKKKTLNQGGILMHFMILLASHSLGVK